MALKRASKPIVISDHSVNSKGFWTLTAGIDRSLFDSNPILLWNHNRPKIEDAKNDDILPIGVIQNLTVDANGRMSGTPAFDDTDPFAMRIYEKYEAGVINMSSAGLIPLEVSTDNKYVKDGAPCLLRSTLAEVSLTDIGSNRGAVKLYQNGQPIELKDATDLVKLFFSPDNKETMLLKLKDFATQLKLADTATEDDVLEAIKKQNTIVVNLTNDIARLTTEKKTADDALIALQASTQKDKVEALVNGAVSAKKITAAEKDHYTKLANTDFATVKSILDAKPGYNSIETQLSDSDQDKQATATELRALIALSGHELFTQDKMDRLKTLSLPDFKAKYREFTGKEYAETN